MSCMRARVGRNLGEQDDTRLASIAHGVSGYFVAVGGLGYLFATRKATLPTEPGSAPISRSNADPLACKDLIVSAARIEGMLWTETQVECIDAPNG